MFASPRANLFLVVLAATISVTLTLRPERARAADLRREMLERQIDHFVSNVVVSYSNDSVERWDTPICPLVAGLSRDRGEFILTRLSQIANASHVPLAGEHCSPNFYVVVTEDPAALLKKWRKGNQTPIDTSMPARGPVRVYYNAGFCSRNGTELVAHASMPDVAGATLSFTHPPCAAAGGGIDTRISNGAGQALTSVIIVVDSKRTDDINIGQLADYVAMVGLAQIRPDADTGMVPTILRVFRQTNQPPQGLTSWDESFLHNLYTNDQNSVREASAIKAGMLEQIGR